MDTAERLGDLYCVILPILLPCVENNKFQKNTLIQSLQRGKTLKGLGPQRARDSVRKGLKWLILPELRRLGTEKYILSKGRCDSADHFLFHNQTLTKFGIWSIHFFGQSKMHFHLLL